MLAKRVHDLAVESGQELKKISFKDQSWLGLKTRSRDATLSRYKGINIRDLELHTKIAISPSGETWRGRWQKNDIIAKILNVRDCNARVSRDFNEEFPKLRIFSHPNILPVIGACNNAPQNLVVISQVRIFVDGNFVIIFQNARCSFSTCLVVHYTNCYTVQLVLLSIQPRPFGLLWT